MRIKTRTLQLGAFALLFLVAACNATSNSATFPRDHDQHYYGSGLCCDYSP